MSVDEIARRLGAVNTVYLKNKAICGTNTDGEGFVASLEHSHPAFRVKNKTAIVIGAGGAAKAIVGALLDGRAERIGIINRTRTVYLISRGYLVLSVFEITGANRE